MILSSEDDPLPMAFDPDRVDPVRFLEQIARLSQEREGPRHVVAGRVRFKTRNYRRFGGLIGIGEVRRMFPRDGVYSGLVQ